MGDRPVIYRPVGTSWASVLCGWIAAIGMAALVAPAVGAILAGRQAVPNDLGLAVPVIVGLMIAYLVGGYVAGRMAGYNTSWHGMLSAFFGLFVALVALLVLAAAELGMLGAQGLAPLAAAFPGLAQLDLRSLGDTLTFGASLAFLATIFAGWLGGVLAPEVYVVATRPAARAPVMTPPERRVAEPHAAAGHPPKRERRPLFRLLPAIGRKGGERADERERELRAREDEAHR